MKIPNGRRTRVIVFLPLLAWSMLANSQGDMVRIDADDIGGVVTSAEGPEAGVWVIAETDDFDTRFARIVVTDDDGRYLVPDLPAADYQLWVRGYGLADSAIAAVGCLKDCRGRLAAPGRTPLGGGSPTRGFDDA